MLNHIGNFTLNRGSNGRRVLTLTVPGYDPFAPKLKHGWTPFFVGRYGHDRTVWSYRKTPA